MAKNANPIRHPSFYRAIPKIELHRHLEGSLRLNTLVEIGRSHGLDVSSTGQLRSLVQINSEEPYTFQNFLSKFETIRLFYRTPEVISRITREAIIDAERDNVRYIELRFTPVALSKAQFSALPFAPIFRDAKQSGLHVTIHAGEWAAASNVTEAILHLGAERIGHGVRVLEDPRAVEIARERGTLFEVCLTSNYQSGVVAPGVIHPIREMMAQGLNVSLNTDDPSISQITLGDEYKVACEQVGLSLDELRERIMAATAGAFLPTGERKNLQRSMDIAWQAWEHET